MVEACRGLLVDHWRSYFSLHVLSLEREKRDIDAIQLLNRENKITAEVSHLFQLHEMYNPEDDKDIYYVAAAFYF